MKWLVRDVQLEDAKAIIDILNPIIKSGTFTILDKPFSLEAEREFISAFPEAGIFHVAVDKDEQHIAGFQTIEPFASYTRFFDHVGVIGTYVDLNALRQGVASSLFHATFAAMRQKGYEKVFAYVRGDNPTALSAYQKHGFSVVGTAKKHAKINERYVDEIIIERFL